MIEEPRKGPFLVGLVPRAKRHGEVFQSGHLSRTAEIMERIVVVSTLDRALMVVYLSVSLKQSIFV